MPPSSHLLTVFLLATLASTIWTTDTSTSARRSLPIAPLQKVNITNSTLPDPGVQKTTLINTNTLTDETHYICMSPYHPGKSYLNYTLGADISGAALSAATHHALREVKLNIRQGMGEEDVGPIFIRDDDLGLELIVYDIEPWIMTWLHLSGHLELVEYCFVEKRVFYEFEAEIWILDVLRGGISVRMWRPMGAMLET